MYQQFPLIFKILKSVNIIIQRNIYNKIHTEIYNQFMNRSSLSNILFLTLWSISQRSWLVFSPF